MRILPPPQLTDAPAGAGVVTPTAPAGSPPAKGTGGQSGGGGLSASAPESCSASPSPGGTFQGFTVGSLFSGIGGLDLGLERAGMKVIWQSEVNEYASMVLAKHWPDVPNLGDVTKIDWSTIERPDVLCGGFPCQPFSSAGRRLGTADDRWLWPEVGRCLRLLRPGHALLENVPGLLTGAGMGDVLGDLAEIGYDAEWQGIPAAAVGAPHLRWRIFIVACLGEPSGRVPHAEQHQLRQLGQRHGEQHREPGTPVAGDDGAAGPLADTDDQRELQPSGSRTQERARVGGGGSDVADARGERRAGGPGVEGAGRQAAIWGQAGDHPVDGGHPRGTALAHPNSPARPSARGAGQALLRPGTVERPGRCSCCDGDHWESEPDVGRVAHGIPNRVDRLRCLGNAVVPQVAEYVGQHLAAHLKERCW